MSEVYFEVFSGGSWVRRRPVDGEVCRRVTELPDGGKGYDEFTWTPDSCTTIDIEHTSSVEVGKVASSTRLIVAKGSRTVHHMKLMVGGEVSNLTDDWVVPIIGADGAKGRNILIPFVDGVADIAITWPESGEWSITQDALNRHVGDDFKFRTKPLFFSVYEVTDGN